MYSIKCGAKLKTKKELFGNVFFPPGSDRDGVKVERPIPKGTIFLVHDFETRTREPYSKDLDTIFGITSFNKIEGSDHHYYFTTDYYKEFHKHFHSLFEPVKGVLK